WERGKGTRGFAAPEQWLPEQRQRFTAEAKDHYESSLAANAPQRASHYESSLAANTPQRASRYESSLAANTPQRASHYKSSPTADVYGAGAVARSLLTDELFPLKGVPNCANTLDDDVLPNRSGKLSDVVTRAVQCDQSQRWPSAEAFQKALLQAIQPP